MGKKNRKNDDYWENEFEQDAEALGSENTQEKTTTQDASDTKPKNVFDLLGGGNDEPNKSESEQEQEGLMGQLNKLSTKDNKKNKKKGQKGKQNDKKESPNAQIEDRREVNNSKESTTSTNSKPKEKQTKKKPAQDKKGSKKKVDPEPAFSLEDEFDEDDFDIKNDESKKSKPVPQAKGKKKIPNISALKQRLEAQKALEDEQKRKEEEERKRIEEEIRRKEEEEREKEEAKRLKKEKEKARKEQLKKEGKLLTKAQKAAKQKAQARLQQLIESGVVVEGLKSQDSNDKPKKILYSNKKKKKPTKRDTPQEDSTVTKAEISLPPSSTTSVVSREDSVKENWEHPSEDENPVDEITGEASVKDNWEDSSEEEETPHPSEKITTQKASSASEVEDELETKYSRTKAAQSVSNNRPQVQKEVNQPSAQKNSSLDNLRSPICCILGHVDTGKTKLLDKIRQTNVQEGEAGGITQQIGATYFPMDVVQTKIACLEKEIDLKVPGLLVIDTPGHESFTNLRSRGSSLCNIAILVVDIMHGLEPQTLESLRLLRDRKTPFIVALNKIDRIYGWDPTPNDAFQKSFAKQSKQVKREFQERVNKTILEFSEQGLNSVLYYDNKNFGKYVSLVPTSAITGEGIPDLLYLLIHLTQTRMSHKLMYLSELECTVLEVKVIEGLGTTIDVVLSNGVLNEGDRIVICGLNGPIATNVRALLTPQPLRELRVKSAYVHHKSVKAALGIKISAPDLEKAIAGSRLLVVGDDEDEEDVKQEVMADLKSLLNSIDKSGRGVYVQASTLGSLEALLEFLRTSEIPVSGIGIGPVHRKDVVRASTMLEKAKEYAVMLCFDVKIEHEARELADDLGVKVFTADIIYHLFDQFTAYHKDILEQKRRDQAGQAVFPCVLKIIPGAVFNKRDPIILGVDVVEGVLRTNTPVCVVKEDPETKTKMVTSLGKIVSIEQNHKSVTAVKRGQSGGGVAVKIECPSYENAKMFGRHFEEKDPIYSKISRSSIDILKESFRNDVSREEWALIIKLKKLLDVQ